MNTTLLRSRIQVSPDPLQDMVFRALDRIDSVHAVSNMPIMPLVITEGTQFGGYIPEREEEHRRFELSRLGPHIELTFTHEIGHFLDHLLGSFEDYASSDVRSVLAPVMQIIAESDAIMRMQAYLQLNMPASMSVRYQLLYWLNPQEQWARAYAQNIAVRSRDERLLQELEIDRRLEGPDVFRNSQWEADDFTQIASAMDQTFTQIGWKV